MPRKNLIRTDEFPYHITARSNNKECFDLPLALLWPIFKDIINEVQNNELRAYIPCYVLMKNHFHLLIWTSEGNIDKVMHFIMKKLAHAINKRSGRINHAFGGPYKWCLITNHHYYSNVVRYICQNPLRAKICQKVEDYPYLHLPNFELLEDHSSQQALLEWLNESVSSEERTGVKKGLQKFEFKVSLNPQNKKPYF